MKIGFPPPADGTRYYLIPYGLKVRFFLIPAFGPAGYLVDPPQTVTSLSARFADDPDPASRTARDARKSLDQPHT